MYLVLSAFTSRYHISWIPKLQKAKRLNYMSKEFLVSLVTCYIHSDNGTESVAGKIPHFTCTTLMSSKFLPTHCVSKVSQNFHILLRFYHRK
jgi:hypothetical protein